MGDQTVRSNKGETEVVKAFKSALKSREDNGLHSGIAVNFYRFDYERRNDIGYKGETFPITSLKSPFNNGRGNKVSFWIRDAEEEIQMKELVMELLPMEDNALLKPKFAVYNSVLDKTIVCCMPFNDEFSNWMSKQTQVTSDDYLDKEAKRMIRSILSFADVLWRNGFVCDGLDDPKNFAMMDSHVKVLPFTIRKKQGGDSEMIHRFKFADLLENHLNTKWNDIDVREFIKCLRDPELSLGVLLNHPVLLPPERRMALYPFLWRENFSDGQMDLIQAVASYGNWVSRVSATDELLVHILTYNWWNPDNKIPMYGNTTLDAFKFSRDTCSHYLQVWRNAIPSGSRPEASCEIVDKPLKKLLPGLLSKIYALTSERDWDSR